MSLLPPRQSTPLPAWGLALGAHTVLVLALTWGVHWKKEADHTVAIQAELWSRVPEQAAPAPVLQPTPVIETPPEPTPVATPEPEIVIKREAKKAPPKPAPEPEKKPAKKAEKPPEKKTTEQQLKALRQDNLRRLSEMAQSSASPTDTGTAAQTRGGPSATYGARIRAAIKPNIVFSDDIASNPTAEIEVRAQRNGTIMSRKIVKSSGNPRWDEAVLKAIDKTQTLPKDTDGSVPGVLLLTFRPKEND